MCAKVQLGATGAASPRRVTREIGRAIFEFSASFVQLVVQVSRVAWCNLFPNVFFSTLFFRLDVIKCASCVINVVECRTKYRAIVICSVSASECWRKWRNSEQQEDERRKDKNQTWRSIAWGWAIFFIIY